MRAVSVEGNERGENKTRMMWMEGNEDGRWMEGNEAGRWMGNERTV